MALKKPGDLFARKRDVIQDNSPNVNESISKIRNQFSKVDELKKQLEDVSSSLNESLTEVVDNNVNIVSLQTQYNEVIEKLNKKIERVKEEFSNEVKALRKSHSNLSTEITILEKRQKGIKLSDLREDIIVDVQNLLKGDVLDNIKHLEERVNIINEKHVKVLTESYNEPPSVKNSDPLTPLDKNFVNLQDFQEHYRLFLTRIQRQLSTLGGGGAVLVSDLDDVERSTAQVNGKYLRYNSTKGKWEGADASGGGGGGGISNVVEDTSPQLGGNLDLNNKNITGTGNISITGNANVSTLNVVGVSTFNEDVQFKGASSNMTWDRSASDLTLFDNTRLVFGNNEDFQIWHGGAHTFMKNSGGDLRIRSNTLILKNQDDDEKYIQCNNNSSVQLFFNNNQKFVTTNTGVVITGICTATSFSGDGSALTGIVGSGSGVVIQHDGSNVGTAGTINFSTNLDVSAISSGIVTVTATGGGGSGISNVVEDTSPELGGNLNVNGNDIVSASNGNIEFTPNGTGKVVFKGVTGNGGNGAGRFVLNCEQNSHGIIIQGPPHSAGANYTLTLPNTDGNADQVLKTNGSGVLDWVDQSSGVTSQSTTFTGSAGTAQVIETYAVGSADCTEFTFHVTSGANIQAQKLLVMDNGSAVHFNQYAVMYSGSKLIDFSADLSGGNVRIKATPETGVSGSITIKSIKQVI